MITASILMYQFQKFQQVLCNFHYFSCFLILNSKIYKNTLKINDWQKKSELVFKYLGPKISLKNGSVLKTNLIMSHFKWDWPQPWELFIFGKIKQKPRCNLLKCLKKIAPWFLPDFSRNQKPPWLESISFETWH